MLLRSPTKQQQTTTGSEYQHQARSRSLDRFCQCLPHLHLRRWSARITQGAPLTPSRLLCSQPVPPWQIASSEFGPWMIGQCQKRGVCPTMIWNTKNSWFDERSEIHHQQHWRWTGFSTRMNALRSWPKPYMKVVFTHVWGWCVASSSSRTRFLPIKSQVDLVTSVWIRGRMILRKTCMWSQIDYVMMTESYCQPNSVGALNPALLSICALTFYWILGSSFCSWWVCCICIRSCKCYRRSWQKRMIRMYMNMYIYIHNRSIGNIFRYICPAFIWRRSLCHWCCSFRGAVRNHGSLLSRAGDYSSSLCVLLPWSPETLQGLRDLWGCKPCLALDFFCSCPQM